MLFFPLSSPGPGRVMWFTCHVNLSELLGVCEAVSLRSKWESRYTPCLSPNAVCSIERVREGSSHETLQASGSLCHQGSLEGGRGHADFSHQHQALHSQVVLYKCAAQLNSCRTRTSRGTGAQLPCVAVSLSAPQSTVSTAQFALRIDLFSCFSYNHKVA